METSTEKFFDVEYVEQHITVDYDMSLSRVINEGGYRSLDRRLQSVRSARKTGQAVLNAMLGRFRGGGNVSLVDYHLTIPTLFNGRRSVRSGTLEELLALGASSPGLQTLGDIFAIGSSFREEVSEEEELEIPEILYPCISFSQATGRGIGLREVKSPIRENVRFLLVER